MVKWVRCSKKHWILWNDITEFAGASKCWRSTAFLFFYQYAITSKAPSLGWKDNSQLIELKYILRVCFRNVKISNQTLETHMPTQVWLKHSFSTHINNYITSNFQTTSQLQRGSVIHHRNELLMLVSVLFHLSDLQSLLHPSFLQSHFVNTNKRYRNINKCIDGVPYVTESITHLKG